MAEWDNPDVLEEVSLTDDLAVQWIVAARLAAPQVDKRDGENVVKVTTDFHARIRQVINGRQKTIAPVGDAWESKDWVDLQEEALLPAAAPLRQTLKMGLAETPCNGACRVEFARTKGGAKFYSTPWFEGWAEPLTLPGASDQTRGGRTAQMVSADAGANLAGALSMALQVGTRVNAVITANAIDNAKKQGEAIGEAKVLLPIVEHLKKRAETAESSLQTQNMWAAGADVAKEAVGIGRDIAQRGDLPQLGAVLLEGFREVNKWSERAARAKEEQRARESGKPPPPPQNGQANGASSPPPAPKRDRAWVEAFVSKVLADGIVSPAELAEIVAAHTPRESVS